MRAPTAPAILLALATFLTTIACAGTPRPPRAAAPVRRSVVAATDYLRSCAGLSLYACLEQHRPALVHYRGADVSVFVDGLPWGPAAKLRDIPAVQVRQVRLLSALEATTAYGSLPGGAVLEVTLRGAVP
jgi:hypothetical protein